MQEQDFYTKTTRSMLGFINEVGAKPFLLFQYYQTYETAPEIRPSLETIARDLGMVDKNGNPQKTAICNLKKILVAKKWIREGENGRIFLLKSFRKSEQHSEKMNDLSENLNERSEKMNGTGVANKDLLQEGTKKEQLEENEREGARETFEFSETKNFPETANLVNPKLRERVDETLFWIQTAKKLSRKNFPAQEWLDLLTDLEAENLGAGENFKRFYVWVESQSWVDTVSPKLLKSQIEKYKKRDELKNKNGIGNGKNFTAQNGGGKQTAVKLDTAHIKRPTFGNPKPDGG